MKSTGNRVLSWQRDFQVGEIVEECDVYMLTKSLHYEQDDFSEGNIGERIEEFLSYELKEIPLSEIEAPWTYIDDERIEDYEEMDENTVPPIVLGFYEDGSYMTIDGGHRVTVALKRKQASIKAFVGRYG